MNDNKKTIGLKVGDIAIGYLLLRVIVGIAYFNIGFSDLNNVTGFANRMVEGFKDTFLPSQLVFVTSLAVRPLEFVVGILITIGWLTRSALIATFCLMAILMYGITLLKNWDGAANQLIYDLVLFVLLAGLGFNVYSVDHKLSSKSGTDAQTNEGGANFLSLLRSFRKPSRRSGAR